MKKCWCSWVTAITCYWELTVQECRRVEFLIIIVLFFTRTQNSLESWSGQSASFAAQWTTSTSCCGVTSTSWRSSSSASRSWTRMETILRARRRGNSTSSLTSRRRTAFFQLISFDVDDCWHYLSICTVSPHREDMYSQDSIDLLQNSGLQFKKHEEEGIDTLYFAELLMTSGLVLCENVKWLSFHRFVLTQLFLY